MNKKKKGLILSVLAILSLVLITTGVTYAFFNYAKEGTTENSITTGTITFLYTEVSGVGKGISIKDAYPVSDEVGKAQTGEGNVFDFKVTSTTPTNASIPYEITARKKIVENILDEGAIKIYLTKVSGTVEDEVVLDNYSNLEQTDKIDSSKYIEKTLHTDKVQANSSNYEQTYRLRMWIDDSINFSPIKDENGQDTYPYNNKTFTVTVNVYANAKVVTEEDIENESKAEISNLTVAGTELTKVENQDYDYETNLPEGTTSTTINIETQSTNARVNIERIDSLAYKESNIKRLGAKKTLELLPGDNFFRITVISENKEVENEYILKVKVPVDQNVFIEGDKLYLYKNGLVNEYLTGGFKVLKQGINSTTTFENDYIYSVATSGNSAYARITITNNKINLTGYTKLHVLYTATGQTESAYNTFGIAISSNNSSYSAANANNYKIASFRGVTENKELVLDIADIDDLYYVRVGSGSLSPFYVYQIWLS